jgi:hypothetical protein
MATLPDLAKALRVTLGPLEFSRKSSTWRRDIGEFVDVIEFRRLPGSNQFTVNVGVLTKSVSEIAWGKKVPESPVAPDCTVHDQVARIHSDRDGWWDVNDPTSLTEIAELVVNTAIPFLDQMHSRERQIQYLRERTAYRNSLMPIYEAILMFECGERDEACSKLRNYKTKYGNESLQKRNAEIAERLKCPKL